MGTKCAPAIANLYMAEVEDELLEERSRIGQPVPQTWLRFIYDIFMVWQHGQQVLDDFMVALNATNTFLRFTSESSYTKSTFLDVSLTKGIRHFTTGILDTSPHFKYTNRFQYLHFSSCHPPHAFSGLVKGETLRMLRCSSSPVTLPKQKRQQHWQKEDTRRHS